MRQAAWVVGVLALLAGQARADDLDIIIQATASALIDPHVHGLELGAAVGVHGVIIGLDAFGTTLTRSGDPTSYVALGADAVLRVSLLGLGLHDHEIEHWFDLGGEAGAGGGVAPDSPASVTLGHAWVGGWMEIGLAPGEAYPALVLDARSVVSSGSWRNETLFTVGLGWVGRADGLWFPK